MAEWTDWADGNDLAQMSRGTDPLAKMGYDPDQLRIDPAQRSEAMQRIGAPLRTEKPPAEMAMAEPPQNPAQPPARAALPPVPADEPPNPVLKQRPQAQPAQPAQPVPDTLGPAVSGQQPGASASASSQVSQSGTGAPGGSPTQPAAWQQTQAQRASEGELSIAEDARKAYEGLPQPPDTTGIDTQIETNTIPNNPRDKDPITGKPLYKPSFLNRVERGVEAFGAGGLPGVLNPGAVGATPYGAPNREYQEDEQLRQGKLAEAQQRKADVMGRFKAATDAITNRTKDLKDVAPLYKDAGTVAVDAQKADTEARKESRESQQNSPEGKVALTDAEFTQRGRQADRLGLTGNMRSIYLANGKLPDPHQPTGEEIARGQAMATFRRQNGRPPQTLEEINQVNAAASGKLHEGSDDGSAVDSIIADATGKKNEFLAQWNRQPDGSYLRAGARPFSTDKADKMTGQEYNAKVDQFRLDANTKLEKHGANIDATGQVVHRTAAGGPPTTSAQSAPASGPPPGATAEVYDEKGKLAGHMIDGKFVRLKK